MHKAMMPVVMLSVLFASANVTAAGKLKPGLWEMTVKSDAMKNAMKNVPPEQLEKMKQMGIKMPAMNEDGMVVKICMTKEMTDRDTPPHTGQSDSGCKMGEMNRSGDSYSVDMVCDGPNLKGTGKATGKFSSAESFSSTYDFKGTSHGQPANIHQESSGKWVGADCGTVKPITDYAQKK
jgi:hypothetical protein